MEIDKSIILEEYYSLLNKLAEINAIKNLLEEFTIQDENYVNIGGFIFAKIKILDDQKFLVNIGENILIEKSKEEILKILEENKRKIEERLSQIELYLKG